MIDSAAPQLIGIGGPSGAGKTVLAVLLQQRLGTEQVESIPLDAYYLSHHNLDFAARSQLNFDSPDALDWPLLSSHMKALHTGKSIQRPTYDYSTHQRTSSRVTVMAVRYVILEGVLALCRPMIREQMRLRVYVECPDDLCLQRRIDRDCRERGRLRESVIVQFRDTVQPMCERFVRPTREHADLVVDGAGDASSSVDLIVDRLVQAT